MTLMTRGAGRGAICLVVAGACLGQPDARAGSKANAARPTYRCCKIATPIRIDGKLDDKGWQGKPVLPLAGIADGSAPRYPTTPKMVWDDRYLYVGVAITDPDVWARAGLRDSECSREFVQRVTPKRSNPEWSRLECRIMSYDKFVKVIVDPDGDGV